MSLWLSVFVLLSRVGVLFVELFLLNVVGRFQRLVRNGFSCIKEMRLSLHITRLCVCVYVCECFSFVTVNDHLKAPLLVVDVKQCHQR